jgi:hypothetical protein
MQALRSQWVARQGDMPGDDLWYPTMRRPAYPLAVQRAKKRHASQHCRYCALAHRHPPISGVHASRGSPSQHHPKKENEFLITLHKKNIFLIICPQLHRWQ